MELLVFGHGGVPILVFPSSQGRFFEYEDRGLVAAVAHKIDAGQIQLFCVDSVDAESWYNRNVPPRWRIARHVQYENYLLDEVLPLIRLRNFDPHLVALGASFGGYHAVNIAMRHPDRFTGFLSMSGAFDLSNFLGGYYDQDVYFNLPPHYLANLTRSVVSRPVQPGDVHSGHRLGRSLPGQNENLSRIMGAKGIPHHLYIWDAYNAHDWPTWARMMNEYL